MKTLAILVIASMSCMSATSALAINDVGPVDDSVRQRGPEAPASIAIAAYDGRTVDLREGWGTATACHVDAAATTTCFDTEAEMDKFIDANRFDTGAFTSAARANCASTLRLYDAISYGVLVLSLNLRMSFINLAPLGFDNGTTSYKVGSCGSNFWGGASGGGSVYPGNTSAFAQFPNMVTGWNNTISSVYIY